MTDPYKVLGVSPSATDEQVKDAYRQLARKYHPDNYVNNPLSDLATEKMKEINEAYDEVQRRRRAGASGGRGAAGQGGFGGYSSGYSGSSKFADIRGMINNGRIPEAEELLDGIPNQNRDAEWYYLKGTASYSKGWLDAALGYYSNACQMDPNNQEYRAAYQRLVYQRQTGIGQDMNGGTSCCETCATVYCCSTLCNCMGPRC